MKPMIAANLDNLLFVLLVAVAILFQLLAKAAAKASKDQKKRGSTSIPGAPPPIPRAPAESNEERIRKFLEALGQPPASRPPPPVAPRTDIPPRPLAPVQPPISPFQQLRREKRRKREMIPAPPIVTPAKEISPPKITVAPAFEVDEGPLPVEPAPIIKTPTEVHAAVTRPAAKRSDFRADLATLLASKSGLREAMILREILGPPRGLRALDATL